MRVGVIGSGRIGSTVAGLAEGGRRQQIGGPLAGAQVTEGKAVALLA